MRDDEQIVTGFASFVDNQITHGMSTVVIECNAGQRVWARCGYGYGFMLGSGDVQSHFTGFALHRFL